MKCLLPQKHGLVMVVPVRSGESGERNSVVSLLGAPELISFGSFRYLWLWVASLVALGVDETKDAVAGRERRFIIKLRTPVILKLQTQSVYEFQHFC